MNLSTDETLMVETGELGKSDLKKKHLAVSAEV